MISSDSRLLFDGFASPVDMNLAKLHAQLAMGELVAYVIAPFFYVLIIFQISNGISMGFFRSRDPFLKAFASPAAPTINFMVLFKDGLHLSSSHMSGNVPVVFGNGHIELNLPSELVGAVS